ncbi:PSD1 and planctomycete cytochrome C domain-containing protein [Tundrisphaera lichenicola]|uniref:PSD1 and planctomycete cytochrome C domain-containing protein n=1 Tax=Tundrisphaera lichenicola TaxID=2029860 RepID=UPI003EB711B0
MARRPREVGAGLPRGLPKIPRGPLPRPIRRVAQPGHKIMFRCFRPIAPLALAILSASSAAGSPGQPEPPDDPSAVEFFEKKVRPLLVENCYNCHSANTNAKGDLRVDDRNGLLQGGSSGPAVVPGKPAESLLIQAVLHAGGVPKMPPKKKLTEDQVADLTRWIEGGAAWPSEGEVASTGKSNEKYEKLRREHWAWQPLADPTAPQIVDGSWPLGEVDHFILAGLEATGLKPAPDADRRALARRVTFDLTGLPPTPEEVRGFEEDRSAEAFERLVDRLLASPAFGERWGRHWLDVARFGESTGSSRNVPYPHAWRYRDYVIDAFNADKPYDQFLREQVAGDLLPADSDREREEHQVATGFLALGVKDVNQRFKVRFVMDNVDEQIDTVSRSALALTASCARCHDHKFDPIPTADYYALAGIFRSTDLCAGVRNKMGGGGLDYYDTQMLIRLGAKPDAPADPEIDRKIAEATKAFEAARKEFREIQGTPEGLALDDKGRPRQRAFRLRMNKAQADLAALTDPTANGGKLALGVRDAKEVADTEIRLRGEAEKLGPVVPRGFLSVVPVPDAPKINPSQSGRLELARWLTSPGNPLTPRVMVNRVWQHLFGEGLVRTVDNFGVTGDTPSHPELLDHLATRFVRDGWSVKRLVRLLVLSRSYRLGSAATVANLEVDPANRLIWRHAPRRLDAEEIRDATLLAAGALDPARPEASPAKDLKVIELPNNGELAQGIKDQARASRHRSIYLPLLRGLTPTSLEVFDFAEQGMVTGRRDATTVAPQALYLLNDPFVRRHALDLADRLLADEALDDDSRADLAYRITLGRPASAAELDRARGYLSEYQSAWQEVAPSSSPAPGSDPVEVIAKAEGDSNSAEESSKPAPAKPAPPVNPDEIITADAPAKEEIIRSASPKAAAWASLVQALFGSAEFRYLP